MSEFQPVTTIADLETLDDAETQEGYFDGYDGEPEPGNNRSRSYWHGWRNGAVDGGHREKDEHQAMLAHEVIETGWLKKYCADLLKDLNGGE